MGTTTVLFTDLASSTEVLVEAGDDGIATLTAHLRSCRDVVEREGGRVTKTMGDGVMALFDSSYQGITAQSPCSRPPTGMPVARATRHDCGSGSTSVRSSPTMT